MVPCGAASYQDDTIKEITPYSNKDWPTLLNVDVKLLAMYTENIKIITWFKSQHTQTDYNIMSFRGILWWL